MMNRDSQILKAVGGLEAAQKIVDGAPEGADFTAVLKSESHYFRECEGRILTDGFECWQDSGYSDFDKLKLEYEGFDWFHLSDLRAAIVQTESVFKVGDRVVCKTGECSVLFAIHSFDSENSEFFYLNVPPCGAPDYREHISKLRKATPEEIAAGHRIDEPQILVRPDEAEILPQCTACATKDHDLTVLRKLQAGNISIYAGRVHRQQTHILIREIIICVLIFACIALFLWGLK